MATITGSEVLAQALRSQGVDTMFYLMGGPMLETEAACIKLGIRAIDMRHEQAAAMMAHAYTRVTRRPGVCMGCSGPGATNLVTGVANAFTDCAPLIAIGGSSPRVLARHGGLPGDRPGRGVQADHQVGRAHATTPGASPTWSATAFRQAHERPARPGLPRHARRRPRREDRRGPASRTPSPGSRRRARSGDPGAVDARPSRCSRRPSARWSSPAAACGGRTAPAALPGLRGGHRHPVLHHAASRAAWSPRTTRCRS